MRTTLVLLLAALLAACGSSGGAVADAVADADIGAGPDAAPDAVADVPGPVDAVADAVADGGPAGPPDGGPDGAPARDGAADGAVDGAADGFGGVSHAGVRAWEQDGVVRVENGRLRLAYDLAAGLLRVEEADGTLVLRNATALARFRVDGSAGTARTTDPGVRTWAAQPFADALGEGLSLAVHHEPEGPAAVGGGPALDVTYDVRSETTYVTAALTVRWAGAAGAVRIDRLSPVVADAASDGGLFVGPDPLTHRWLDNGSDMYFDFSARVVPAAASGSLLFAPGQSSNWDAAVHDPVSGRSVVAGFLSFQRAVGLVAIHWPPSGGPVDDGPGGARQGFQRFEGLCHYEGGRAALALDEGVGLASELFYVDFAPATPFDGLEAYAERFARRRGKQTTTDVPTGWNSWGGGSRMGGYASNIDEALILANLEAAQRDWLPYRMKWFFIDDGWQIEDGDWFPRTDRFPDHDGQNGMVWLAEQIRAAGMTPGLWIRPFDMDHDSQLAQAHPDWVADVNVFGQSVVPDDRLVLDVTHPEVLAWLEELFHRLTYDWGYRWIKMDFSYYALFTEGLHDPAVTPSEAYHDALVRCRAAMHPDTFYLAVTPMGLAFDVADADRLGLDNQPLWGDVAGAADQGLQRNYATTARRYYLNHRVFINHPDVLFYRDGHGLTLAEARVWTSVVGLTGGIVKLGDPYVEHAAHPEWRALVQPLLPVYPKTGRPLDLFVREYPEVWHLAAEREGRRWAVLGLFNWGPNRDIGQPAFEPEETRTWDVALADLGLDGTKRHLVFRSWEKTWTWAAGGVVSETLAPRTDAVLVIREEPAAPAIVFTSRHLLGGAVEIHDEVLGDGVLTATIDTVPGEPTTVWIAAAGAAVTGAEAAPAAAVTHEATDGLVVLRFTPATAETALTVRFDTP